METEGIPAQGKKGAATRYVHPESSKSIIVDNETGEIFHVGGTTLGINEVYVNLLNEGIDVVRPVFAEHIADDIYWLADDEEYDPDIEEWEFPPGSVVRCVDEIRSDRYIKVAVALASV